MCGLLRLSWNGNKRAPAQHPQPVVGDSLEQEPPKPVLPLSCLKSKPGIEIFFSENNVTKSLYLNFKKSDRKQIERKEMAWMWPLAGFMTARQCRRSESFALVPGPEHQVRAVCSNPSNRQPYLPGCQAEDKLGCSLLRREHWYLACLWVPAYGWVGWALGLEASPGNHSCGLRLGHSEVPRSSKVRTSLEIVVYLLNRTCRCHLSRAPLPSPPMYLESVEATRDPPTQAYVPQQGCMRLRWTPPSITSIGETHWVEKAGHLVLKQLHFI